jgi:hypothetical protein
MSQSPGASPQAGPAGQAPEPADPGRSRPQGADSAATAAEAEQAAEEHPHNFAVQKEVHRQIRNDPDYDDWEYGTEPLPSEAWRARAQATD